MRRKVTSKIAYFGQDMGCRQDPGELPKQVMEQVKILARKLIGTFKLRDLLLPKQANKVEQEEIGIYQDARLPMTLDELQEVFIHAACASLIFIESTLPVSASTLKTL